MAQSTRTCRVCGCEYPYCKTENRTGTFRFQDVACSPEHGSIYLESIRKSRALNKVFSENLDIEFEDEDDSEDYEFEDIFDEEEDD